jgi:hypothetical protein
MPKRALLLNRTFPPSRAKQAAIAVLGAEEGRIARLLQAKEARQHEPLPPVVCWNMQLAALADRASFSPSISLE